MRTRFPQCTECNNPIDPMNDAFSITNADEAKYGSAPEYAHEVCPALVAEEACEESFALEDNVPPHQFDVEAGLDEASDLKHR